MYIILNKELEQVAEITTFSSINWEEEYLSQTGGDFEIVLPASTYSNLGIEDGFFIYKTDSLKFGIVNYVEYTDNFTENEEIEQLITLKGEMGESILKRRVLSFQLNKSGTLDDLVSSVIYTHFTNPKDTNRQINLEYVRNNSFSNYVSKCITGCTVAELMESLCSLCDCSYRVLLDLNNKKFLMKLIKGEDKSSNVVFCKIDNNLSEFTLVKSKENYASHIVVAGEGNGSDRKTVTVSNSNMAGMDRIEKFVDKKSLSSKDMNPITYIDKLYEEGRAELSKYSITEASSFDIFLNNYEYRKDFNLGDKVAIKNENLGIETTTRVLAALTSIDENGIESTQLTLGDIAEIELAEDETTIEQEEYTPEDTDENGDVIDTTWDTKVTQITTEYLKIFAEDSAGVTLSDLEFSGGFFKIAENVYVMCLKNNTGKDIKKIYYSADENILKSENEIYGSSVIESIDCMSHRVDSTSKHEYDCSLRSYCNITKIITVGEPLVEEIDGYELYNVATLKVVNCIDIQAGLDFYADRDQQSNNFYHANIQVAPATLFNSSRERVRISYNGDAVDAYRFRGRANMFYIDDNYKTTCENWVKNRVLELRYRFDNLLDGVEYKVYARKTLANGTKTRLAELEINNSYSNIGVNHNQTVEFYIYAPKNTNPELVITATKFSVMQFKISDTIPDAEEDGYYYTSSNNNNNLEIHAMVNAPVKTNVLVIRNYDNLETVKTNCNTINNYENANTKVGNILYLYPKLGEALNAKGEEEK